MAVLTVLIVSTLVGGGGLAGGYFWGSSNSKVDKKTQRRLAELEKERIDAQKKRDKEIQKLATVTKNQIVNVTQATHTVQHQIKTQATTLANTTKTVNDSTKQLQTLSILLDELTKGLTSETKPLVVELKKIIHDLVKHHEELTTTSNTLKKTVEQLTTQITLHLQTQQKLQTDSQEDKKLIQSLVSKLNNATLALTHFETHKESIEKTELRHQNQALSKQVDKLQEQNNKATTLLKDAKKTIQGNHEELHAQLNTIDNLKKAGNTSSAPLNKSPTTLFSQSKPPKESPLVQHSTFQKRN